MCLFNKKNKKRNKEIYNYSLGECPFCNSQGLLKLGQLDGKVKIICDEAYHVFNSIDDVKNKKLDTSIGINAEFISFEEAIKSKFKNDIYIYKNNEWKKLKN